MRIAYYRHKEDAPRHHGLQTLTDKEESIVVAIAAGFRSHSLAVTAEALCEWAKFASSPPGEPSKGKDIGEHWVRGFLDRHPKVKLTKGQAISVSRTGSDVGANTKEFAEWIEANPLHDLLGDDRIFAVDEMGAYLTQRGPHVDATLASRDPEHNANEVHDDTHNKATLSAVVSGDGDVLLTHHLLVGTGEEVDCPIARYEDQEISKHMNLRSASQQTFPRYYSVRKQNAAMDTDVQGAR